MTTDAPFVASGRDRLNTLSPGPLIPGQIVLNKYQVISKLGQGGMGTVWLVRHLEIDGKRALKLFESKTILNDEGRARLRREAQVMGRLNGHPNTVYIHDAYGRLDNSVPFIEMDYVAGESLDKVLKPGVPMPVDWVARIADQLCDALHFAHEQNIIHRDLKPSNLMLVDGRPPGRELLKVLDFGIAKILDPDNIDLGGLVTMPGHLPATPIYMSPEQAQGDPTELDRRSDIYTVGVILYEMLTGRQPFEGARYQLPYQHVNVPAPPFAEKNPDDRTPPELEQLVLRCLEKEPAGRPQTARELAEEFRRIVATPVGRESEGPVVPPTAPWWRGFAIAMIALASLSVLAWWAFRPPPGLTDPLSIPSLPKLDLVAGGEAVSVVIPLNYRSSPSAHDVARADPIRSPYEDVKVEEGPASSDALNYKFKVTDLNARPGPRRLSLRVTRGRFIQLAEIDLEVHEPKVFVPGLCTGDEAANKQDGPAACARRARDKDTGKDAELVRVGDRVCPKRIELVLRDGRTAVPFLLIEVPDGSDVRSFYIMEDKVWNGLFQKFDRKHPGDPKDQRLPVVSVTPSEAGEFARSLGGSLPSPGQWDEAAGFHKQGNQVGPFRNDGRAVAVSRDEPDKPLLEKPVEVGSARDDVSPFGCHDMAGNGQEFTSGTRSRGEKIETILRGKSFRDDTPLTYKEIKEQQTSFDTMPNDMRKDSVGFRVVIAIPGGPS